MSKLAGYEHGVAFRDHHSDYETGSQGMEPSSQLLYSRQGDVPRLPVPDLNASLDLFLKSSKPHVTEEEFEETKRKVEEFRSSELAKKLQNRLIERKNSLPNTSWFAKWWNEYGYFGYRDSIVWNVSYYLQFRDEFAYAMSPTRRAARFVYHSLFFRQQIMDGTLEPDMRKNTPMSNTQYKYMFNACRMPGKETDFVRTYPGDIHHHIVVARKNRFFCFDVIDSATGKMRSIDEIEAQLNRVVEIADRMGTDTYPVGILTAGNRDDWYNARELLLRDDNGLPETGNAECLEKIQSSICGVCLDDRSPTTREQVGRELLHSDGRNRFWDKAFQLVFFENGKGGYVGEHALMDGLTTTRMVNFVLERMWKDDIETQSKVASPKIASLLSEPELQQFALSEKSRDSIVLAEKTFDDIIATKELKVLMFYGYGKQQIKKMKMSPDAFAQMAIQLAYRKTFGQCRGTYESTQTRSFLHGRTEVTRSVSTESEAFCDAMTTLKSSPKECYEKLLAATQSHSQYTKLAANAQGCDRHLLGLKLALQPNEPLPEFYSDPGYTRSGTWALSTSGLVGELMDGWGFGEVVPHGIGIGYSVQNNRLRFTVSSRHPQQQWAQRMVDNLESSLVQMQQIVIMSQQNGNIQSKL